MWRGLIGVATGEVKAEAGLLARRALKALVLALSATALLIMALGAVLFALFFWLEALHGPVIAALLVAALAFVLAVLLVIMARFGGKAQRPAASFTPLSSGDGPGAVSPMALALGALVLGLLFGRKL